MDSQPTNLFLGSRPYCIEPNSSFTVQDKGDLVFKTQDIKIQFPSFSHTSYDLSQFTSSLCLSILYLRNWDNTAFLLSFIFFIYISSVLGQGLSIFVQTSTMGPWSWLGPLGAIIIQSKSINKNSKQMGIKAQFCLLFSISSETQVELGGNRFLVLWKIEILKIFPSYIRSKSRNLKFLETKNPKSFLSNPLECYIAVI